MEISKSLLEEIVDVQRKLHSAILEHQTSVDKLKNDPNNQNILGQIKKIEVHIVTLGKCQDQIVQRLRKEINASKADNVNRSKISIPSLFRLNNNNHITNNNETKHEAAANGFETKPAKEDYGEVVRNGDVHRSRPRDNDCAKLRPSSVETVSGEDDVVEVSLDENSDDKQEEVQKEHNIEISPEKCHFLYCLGLISTSKCMELQNRRAERKRRSTANPHFVYSMSEQPSKRKRHSYLQSGNAPHTRQTTARMNGPSPPPNKTRPTKSTSPPAQMKSLIPIQKSTTRPNILRNADSRVFVNKNKMEDSQMQLSVSSAKSVQSMGNNKAVHIPGLPSSLTIERIGSDSIVCIRCENPGSLTTCKNCSSSYHISCHTRSSPPPRICPKCVLAMDEEEDIEKDEDDVKGQTEGENKLLRYKKDEKFATTTNASGFTGKAREDSEVYKASGGLHKIDTAQKKHMFFTGVNQLPASTFIIPITASNVSTSNANKSEGNKFASVFDTEYRKDTVHHNHHVVNHLSRPNITYVSKEQVSHSYQLPGVTIQPEKQQSYFIVQNITDSPGRPNQSPGSETEDQCHSTTNIFNYQLSTNCGSTIQTSLQPVVTHSLFYDRNKQTNRAIPLQPVTISKLSNSRHSISNDHQLDRATFNGRKPWAKLTRGKLCINQSARSATEILLSSCNDVENSGNEQQRPRSTGSAEEAVPAANLDGRRKHRSKNFIHSLFSSHNKSHTITNRARESRGFGPNDRDCPLLRQQLCREERELEQHEQSDGKPATVQLQRRALTRFFEHVKLEEAHIPAPLRTELAHKDEVGDDDDDDEIAREDSPPDKQYDDGGVVAEASLLTSCDMDDDRLVIRVPWLTDNSKNACDDDNVASKALVRRLSDAASTQSDDYAGYELTRIDRRSSVILRHSTERENDRSTTTTTTTAAAAAAAAAATATATATATVTALRIVQSNLSELRNEVSVPDDKADTEKQDLPSGGQLRSRSNSSSSSSSSSSSGHSDTPEQAMNVNDLTNDFNILAKMGLVSPEGRSEEQIGDESTMTSSEIDAATG